MAALSPPATRCGSSVRRRGGEVDAQAKFDEASRTHYSATLRWDRVHPNQVGHMIIARAFLEGVGFEW
jgi:hypothetical protein